MLILAEDHLDGAAQKSFEYAWKPRGSSGRPRWVERFVQFDEQASSSSGSREVAPGQAGPEWRELIDALGANQRHKCVEIYDPRDHSIAKALEAALAEGVRYTGPAPRTIRCGQYLSDATWFFTLGLDGTAWAEQMRRLLLHGSYSRTTVADRRGDPARLG